MATTAAKASVSRARKVRGRIRRRNRRSVRIGVGRPSALGERVADAADGEDEGRVCRVVFELLPEVADVDVDRLLVLVERLVVADQLEQLGAGVNASRARGDVAQDVELRGGRGEGPVA